MLKRDIYEAITNEEAVFGGEYEREELADIDCSHLDFQNCTFSACRFEHCDFTGSSIIGVRMEQCQFVNCTFNSSFFKDSTLVSCRADKDDLSHSVFKGTAFQGGSYCYANFRVPAGSAVRSPAAIIQMPPFRKTALRV